MITPAALLKDLKRLVRDLEDDIRDGLPGSEADGQLQRQWQAAKDAGRTAATYESWREEEITQSAVHWVLGGVFLRFIEDNGLVERPWLAGPNPERMALARDRYEGYFRAHPHESDRDYLLACFTEAGQLHGAAALFDTRHNPVWELPVSGDGGIALMNFWTKADPDSGRLVHDFSDPELSTRFLGDLYQDLSEAARKRYALLQTPEFVEEFILDRTLTPAIQEFGFREVRLIDPTCGSGHFLLGAFHRLVREWSRAEPGRNIRDVAQRALDAVAGVDINPFATAIARFRLLVSALKVCGIGRLADAPDFRFELAAGDSLLHGKRFAEVEGVQLSFNQDDTVTHVFHAEDRDDLDRILGRQYHAVVGNPPYIQVKDKALNAAYRPRYSTCHMKYSLGVPFTQRFFNLTLPKTETAVAGFVGLITANSFMKREFGSKLIEVYLPRRDLTHIVNTDGAYIPGHGTPTVILFGRNRPPVAQEVRVVMGVKGEPGTPADPAQGKVWTSILDQIDRPGSQGEFVSVENLPRVSLAKHPWSMGGGGANELKEALEAGAAKKLAAVAESVGITSFTLEDDAYIQPREVFPRVGIVSADLRPMVMGDQLRDWAADLSNDAIFPYDADLAIREVIEGKPAEFLWPFRTNLSNSKMFNGKTKVNDGLKWYEYGRLTTSKLRSALAITFAFVATHNHFFLDRGGKVFNRTAPVIKLPVNTSEADHLALIGLLNGSSGCFWMKQSFQNRGSTVDDKGARQRTDPFEDFYEFTGTGLLNFPLAEPYPLDLARELDSLAQQLSTTLPSALLTNSVPTRAELDGARDRALSIRRRMIALQDELDWRCYKLYGVVDGREAEGLEFGLELPEVDLGQRAFEIVMARKMAADELETTWFTRHGSVPTTEIPDHWPAAYRAVVERRIALIESHRYIGLVEKPEYKRRWQWSDAGFESGWAVREKDALERWQLDRLEEERYWQGDPALKSVNVLADLARGDAEFCRAAALYEGQDHPDLATLVARLVAKESVPFLPSLRYAESGRRKRAQWERVWDLQRREDEGSDVDAIDVPPKYKREDFLNPDFWRLRGGLDVPKERFISYPGAEKSADGGLMVAWAGFDHLAQARALAGFYHEMKDMEGWDAPRLIPLLAGLADMIPWLKQWHNAYDADFGQGPGDWFAAFLAEEARTLGVTADDIAAWEPAAKVKAKRARKAKATDQITLEDLGL